MIEKLIDKTKSEDLLYLTGIIINILNTEKRLGKTKHSILPELFSTLGIDNTVNLIKYFGGETLTIPSHEEMTQAFLIIVCYYKKKIEGKDWEVIKVETGIDISPHTLGKIIENIDARIDLEMEDLRSYGIDKYMQQLKKLGEAHA